MSETPSPIRCDARYATPPPIAALDEESGLTYMKPGETEEEMKQRKNRKRQAKYRYARNLEMTEEEKSMRNAEICAAKAMHLMSESDEKKDLRKKAHRISEKCRRQKLPLAAKQNLVRENEIDV